MKLQRKIEQEPKIPTNSSLDELLGGGIEKGNITQVYGPPGSGKTNIALILAVEVAKNGKKVIYMDTEGGLSIDRIEQIAKDDFEKVINNIIVFEPHSFEEQENDLKAIKSSLNPKSDDIVADDVDLIVLDSVVALYRLNGSNSPLLNKKLGKQMGDLSTLSRKYKLAVFITNQIYSSFNGEGNGDITPVGGDILKYWSKVIIELEKSNVISQRVANLKRHRSMAEGISTKFKITSDGIQ
ncbi:MAG: DNA repair and recombination protein RadB [Methanobrevibacter sp.]|jgi:DNA repair protein RadB|nr:DNA repair and recombination protein RadB [Methanobrevibacter sp.]